jgi:hypothetical protein
MSEVVLCADDKLAVIDLARIRCVCPPILRRFLGLCDDDSMNCFKKAARDENGYLTFAKQLDISCSHLQKCLVFLNTGYVDDINVLSYTMDVLGGSEKLDAYMAKKQAERDALEALRVRKLLSARTNPMKPETDWDNLYIWRAHQTSWHEGLDSDDWSMTERTGMSLDYWWRKRRDDPEVKEEEEEEEL